MEKGLKPATEKQIMDHLTKLAICTSKGKMPEAAWKIFLETLVEDLADCPVDILEDACREWRQNHRFFPKSAEILGITRDKIAKRRYDLSRCLQIAAVSDLPAPGGVATLDWLIGLWRRGKSLTEAF